MKVKNPLRSYLKMTIERNSTFLTKKSKVEYDNCYTTVLTNSASWTPTLGGVASITKNTVATGAITFNGSGVTQAGNTFSFSSVDLTDVSSASGGWQSVYTKVNTSSASWDSVYTKVHANSADWDSAYDQLHTLSGNWDSVYNQVTTLSTTWGANYISSALLYDYDNRYVNITGDTLQGNINMGNNDITNVNILSATSIYTVASLSASDIVFTGATLATGSFKGTGYFLTLNINGSALYMQLYKKS